jgi:ribosomal-protein-alanine N-acetyltransferase
MSESTFRTLRLDDASQLLQFELDNRAWFERHIAPRADDFYTRDGVLAHIGQCLAAHADGSMHPCVIVDRHGRLAGRANLKDIDRHGRSAEVGYRIGQRQAGQGLATAALRHLIVLARSQWRLASLCAYAIDANLASVRVLERCGFTRGADVPGIALVAGVAVDGHRFALELAEGDGARPPGAASGEARP